MSSISVTLLGVRGSTPVFGKKYEIFGGSTTCARIDYGSETLLLDAGSGMSNCGPLPANMTMVISHPHADHLIGFPMWASSLTEDKHLDVYARRKQNLSTDEQIFRIMSPPLWPLTIEQTRAKICCHDLDDDVTIGSFRIRSLDAPHPGGSTVFRIDAGGRSVVFATDCELADETDNLVDLARDCSLLLVDGQYTQPRPQYGHNSIFMAADLAASVNAGIVRVIHHAPENDDDVLLGMEKEFIACCAKGKFGREGEVILI